MKIIAETPHVRLVCDGKEHVGVDKQNGIRYIVQKCDCKDRKEPAAEVAPAPAVSEVPQVPAGLNSLRPAGSDCPQASEPSSVGETSAAERKPIL